MLVSEFPLIRLEDPRLAKTDEMSLSLYRICKPNSFEDRFDIKALLPWKLSWPSPQEEKFFELIKLSRDLSNVLLRLLKF
jgi:hypothetical protein